MNESINQPINQLTNQALFENNPRMMDSGFYLLVTSTTVTSTPILKLHLAHFSPLEIVWSFPPAKTNMSFLKGTISIGNTSEPTIGIFR